MVESHYRCNRVSDTVICPFCYSVKIIRNGTTKTRKQQYICKECHKRFLDYYTYKAYHSNVNSLIIQLTKEGLGIRSISRVLQISATTLLRRIKSIAQDVTPPILSFGRTYELDEMRFFIKKKSNPMWLVYAIDKVSKEIAAFYIGKRNNQTLNAVVKTLLNAKATTIFTDKLKNYQYLIPKTIHNTQRYQTNGIERMNLALRTHLKRLNRRTIGFSRSITILSAILKIYFWS